MTRREIGRGGVVATWVCPDEGSRDEQPAPASYLEIIGLSGGQNVVERYDALLALDSRIMTHS